MHPWVGLSDHVRLGVLTRWVTPELVAEALAECGVRDKKPGALPAGFMVYFTLALALFQQDSYDDVAENLVGAIAGMGGNVPNKASFTRARQRLGPQVLEYVYRALSGALAQEDLPGSFYQGMRLAAVDGFVLDAPDTAANRSAFGGPSKNGQPAGFPQVRVVTLTECGTHAQVDAAVGGFNGGERDLAIALAGSSAGMLVVMDRNFPGVALWKAYLEAGAHLLLRARSPVAHRPVEHLGDGTYLARMNLAGQKGAHPGGVLVRVIEYRVDGGEVVRLLTDPAGPAGLSGGGAGGPVPGKMGGGVGVSADQDVPARTGRSPALGRPGPCATGGMGTSGCPSLSDTGHHAAGRRQRDRPGPGVVRQGPQARPPQRGPPEREHAHEDQEIPGRARGESPPQTRQRNQATARG